MVPPTCQLPVPPEGQQHLPPAGCTVTIHVQRCQQVPSTAVCGAGRVVTLRMAGLLWERHQILHLR